MQVLCFQVFYNELRCRLSSRQVAQLAALLNTTLFFCHTQMLHNSITYETWSTHECPYYLYYLLGTAPYGICENYRRPEQLAVFYFRNEVRRKQQALFKLFTSYYYVAESLLNFEKRNLKFPNNISHAAPPPPNDALFYITVLNECQEVLTPQKVHVITFKHPEKTAPQNNWRYYV